MEQQITDQLTEEGCAPRVTWTFCGKIPLTEVAAGRRACRANWRSGEIPGLGTTPCMLALFCSNSKSVTTGEAKLCVQWEYEDTFEGGEEFCFLESLLAEDWYLEDPRLS